MLGGIECENERAEPEAEPDRRNKPVWARDTPLQFLCIETSRV